MASTYLTKTFTASNRKTFTISFWIKRSGLTSNQCPFGAGTNHSTDRDFFAFIADSGEEDKLYFNSKVSNSTVAQFYTSRRFRDTNAWYHIVLAFDTTQATDSERMKLYVNGEQQTYQSQTYPSQNQDMNYNNTVHTVGSSISPGEYLDGCMSHFHFIDGTQYAASTFGSTDATTGEWKINTSPSVTYGTNGFFILKDGNGVTDQSGNSNNFTVGGGTLTTLQDNPSNSFATINRLNPNAGENISFSAGNTSIDSSGGAHRNAPATIYLPLGNGKFYWEMKVDRMSTHVKVGLVYDEWSKLNKPTPGEEFSASNQGYAYRNDGQKENNGLTSYGNSYTVGDIIGIAFDTENRNLYFAKNGTWQNSGDPTSGSTGTGKAFTVDADYVYAPIVNLYDADVSFNFGNGYFATTAISSEGTNASGIGKFEYDVPTGYTALSTKGLNE